MFAVAAPPEKVWSFLMDPLKLSGCIEDPHTVEIVDENTFKGKVKTGVAFIKGTFTASAKIVEKEPPRRARIRAHGTGMGSAFDVDATLELSVSGQGTTVRWGADVVLNGTIASVGARLLQGTIDKKTNQFFENVRKNLESG